MKLVNIFYVTGARIFVNAKWQKSSSRLTQLRKPAWILLENIYIFFIFSEVLSRDFLGNKDNSNTSIVAVDQSVD